MASAGEACISFQALLRITILHTIICLPQQTARTWRTVFASLLPPLGSAGPPRAWCPAQTLSGCCDYMEAPTLLLWKSNVYFIHKGHLSWGAPISDVQTSPGAHGRGRQPPPHSSLNNCRSRPSPDPTCLLESGHWVSAGSRKGPQKPPPTQRAGASPGLLPHLLSPLTATD